jgi:predicted nuclease with RNAse H fold
MTGIHTGTLLGIDLTTVERRPSGCALLDASGALVSVCKLATDEDILGLVRARRPAVVAIDSPLGLPTGMDCLEESCGCESVHPFKGRAGERELISLGISLYLTTKRSTSSRWYTAPWHWPGRCMAWARR